MLHHQWFSNSALEPAIGKVQKTEMDSNWMPQGNFRPMLMMLIHWAKKILIINTKTKEISICSKEADLVQIQALPPEHRTKSQHQYS
jgi:hypothetical protein